MTISSGQQALAADVLKHATASGHLRLAASTELTIASGAVTANANFYRVDTEGDAASDDLDTITAGSEVADGFLLFLRAENAARTVVIKHNTGNVLCEGGLDVYLQDTSEYAVLVYDGNLTKWICSGKSRLMTYSNSGTTLLGSRSTLSLLNLDNTANNFAGITFYNSAGKAVAAIDAILTHAAQTGALKFTVNNAGTSKTGLTIAADGDVTFGAGVDGVIYVGDSANANMTQGITINMGAADDEALALKSSDVAHGVTGEAETDTYGVLKKHDGTGGGLSAVGYGASAVGVHLRGVAANANTDKGITSQGVVHIQAYEKSGTGIAAPSADSNLLVILTGTTPRFIFDAEGSAHADVEWTTFDVHNDVALLEGLERAMLNPVQAAFGEFLDENRRRLQELGIVNFYDNGPRAMVNFSRLTMLLVGAVRQVSARALDTEARLQRLERRLLGSGA